MTDVLSMWVVYEHPKDFPASWVARRWDLRKGHPVATANMIETNSLAEVRALLERMGLTCMPRDPRDEPQIVEVWL